MPEIPMICYTFFTDCVTFASFTTILEAFWSEIFQECLKKVEDLTSEGPGSWQRLGMVSKNHIFRNIRQL